MRCAVASMLTNQLHVGYQRRCWLFLGDFSMVEAPRSGEEVTNGSLADLRRQRLYSRL